MTELRVRVEDLSKRYRLGERRRRPDTLAGALGQLLGAPLRNLRRLRRLTQFAADDRDVVWALRELGFEVRRGEAVGIVGRNGSGKSTLLRILSRITYPTHGRAELWGRVSSLLEVGTGFHPELSGRENVFLNGTLLGMSRREVARKLDAIVAFAEVEEFLDTPVKRYSTGMGVRLAFAVAAHLEPEVLLVDEVLAVGDAGFQRKCLARMEEAGRDGRTVLFVSHDLAAVQRLCPRTLLLERGRLVADGPTPEVLADYLERTLQATPLDLETRADRRGDGSVRLLRVRLCGEQTGAPACGGPARLLVDYRAESPPAALTLVADLTTPLGGRVLRLSNELSGDALEGLPAAGTLACAFARLPLLPGSYGLNLSCARDGRLADAVVDAGRLEVGPGDFYGSGKLPPPGSGALAAPHRWSVEA